ncbi:sucrase ferredoxin [Nocardia mangyaensis]|uniref:sucrase ferredoxin n=1 Tax=Nocardia mangyaensis TaxID=2213200 RepID=UPI00267745EF|nr:sucrase ferredoxin [Nocardia mangyaensis]MDO3647196.1 sucrase ferredoxin [Nocardia mangyaensis]
MTPFDGLSCTAASVDLPMLGTAAHVTGWLCVEHPGAWGRDVLGDEVLGPEITAELAARSTAAHVRPTLIRRPGRNEFTGTRTVLLAASRPQGSWCERFEITDLRELFDIDLRLVDGPAPGIGAPVDDPVVLVCAHGKRDQCCARLGRPIAAALATENPGRVWEASHTGGHRLAPAVVLLPSGLTYGRLDIPAAHAALAAAESGQVSLTGLRGRGCYDPIAQLAEVAVREQLPPTPLDDLTVHPDDDPTPAGAPGSDPTVAGTALVTHSDGRRWRVTARTVAAVPRQASCGGAPKPATYLEPADVQQLPHLSSAEHPATI